MPRAGFLWRHVIINTKCTWLHGSPKGFRSRNPEIRSSGDYKNPPPKGEYEKLYKYFKKVAGPEVHIPMECLATMGQAMLQYLREQGYPVLAIAVNKVHGHLVTELPKDRPIVKRIIGHVKRKSSRAVKRELPGEVWSAGGEYKIVRTREHLFRAFEYVLYKQGAEAWTWSFKDRSDAGKVGRKRRRGAALRSAPP